jgi:hypothetical protein
MNRRLKTALSVGLMALGLGFMGKAVQAATSDTMVVSVTPLPTFAVSITSPSGSGYNFGNVALGATTLSTAAIVLNTGGANSSEYFGVSISNTSGNWTATSSAPGTDTFRMGAWVGTNQPAITSVTDYLSNGPFSGAAAGLFNQGSRTAASSTANLWLRLELPTALNTGTSVAQTMTLTVVAQGS